MQSACSDNTTRLAVVGMSPPLHAPRHHILQFMLHGRLYLSDTSSTQMPLESTSFTFLFPIKTTYVLMVRFRFGNRHRRQQHLVRRCKQTACMQSRAHRRVLLIGKCAADVAEDVNRARAPCPARPGGLPPFLLTPPARAQRLLRP